MVHSWVDLAKIHCTTSIDRVYSLLGLFNVNMPLLYGEGMKAFIRLQEEILKETEDESLFVYQKLDRVLNLDPKGSLLAQSPDFFATSADIILYDRDVLLGPGQSSGESGSAPSPVTNRGLQAQFLGCPCRYESFDKAGMKLGSAENGWLILLNCRVKADIMSRPAIFLEPMTWKTIDTSAATRVLF